MILLSWTLKEKLQKTLEKEQGACVFPPGLRAGFALAYPNTYHVGMSNLGFHIIYQQINSRNDTACERVFMPDKKSEQEYIRTNTPLLTIETQRPIYEFGLIGFAVSFEMDYFNLIKMLSMGKITLLAKDRKDFEPIIIIGGPCATFNPEPLADIVDVCVIGEGEEVIHEILDTYYQGKQQDLTRSEILFNMAQISGVYVPRFYTPLYDDGGIVIGMSSERGVPTSIHRRWIKELDKYPAHTVIATSDTEFKDMFLVEVARGCGRHCRFCMAGYCFRQPRSRSLEQLYKTLAYDKLHKNKIGLMGAAISDYPHIDNLCHFIIEKGMTMSVASLRADSLSKELVESLAFSGQKTITLAPEAGSERMRKVINKTITNEHMYNAIKLALESGISNVRLYIMIGLPYEEQEDVEDIVTMAQEIKAYMGNIGSKGKITLSINPFIPKPLTPFQWVPMEKREVVETRLKYVQERLKGKKGIEILAESSKESYIQGVLARGDRQLGKVLLAASQNGGPKWFKKAMEKWNLTEDNYIYRERSVEEFMPWGHLEMGFSAEYIKQELQKSQKSIYTMPCFDGCTRCGVCKDKEGMNL